MFAGLGDAAPVIVSYARTAFGSLNGALSACPAPRLGAVAIKAALERAGSAPDAETASAAHQQLPVGEVLMGNVLSAGLGQAPATQAARYAGLGDNMPATTINKVCASGAKTVAFAAQAVALRHHACVVAGGMESMTRAPHYLLGARSKGLRLGDAKLADGLIHDGLWDPYKDKHMGNCAETLAREMNISRADQDEYAARSYARAKAGRGFHAAREIVPFDVAPFEKKGGKKQTTLSVVDDEEPVSHGGDGDDVAAALRALRPAFQREGGTVTAGNASTINDGAAAVVVAARGAVEERGIQPLAEILAVADAQTDPEHFTVAPSLAVPKALDAAGLKVADVDLFEINEAFSIVAIANAKLLGIPLDNLNIHGGAVSIGHPIGASGTRIVGTLALALHYGMGNVGVAAVCNGGGGATAVVLRALR